MRIVRTRNKVVYFIVTYGLLTVLTYLLIRPLIPESIGRNVLQSVLGVLVVVGAMRWFRGPDENIVAPRPWWRATNRPKASFVLGGLVLASLVNTAIQDIVGLDTAIPDPVAPLTIAIALIQASYYLNSGIRLRRLHLPPKNRLTRPKETTPTPS